MFSEKSLTAHFACRAIDCKEGLKKMPAVNASEKAKKSRAWNADCVQAQPGTDVLNQPKIHIINPA